MMRRGLARLSRGRLTRLGALLAAGALLLSGCGFHGVYDLPLPGGPDLGEHPITVHALLDNVYDLVPQESVKVNDVPVGKVTDIRLGHGPGGSWKADVVMLINSDTTLPSNTTAELRQTSLLGEKFIELTVPANPRGKLADGATIGQDKTYHHVEVEELLGALSMLLNNGGLQQIQTISQQLQQATSGNEQAIRATLSNVDALAAGLDAHSDAITRALDGLDELSATLDKQRTKLTNVIDNIGPGLRSLNQQRDQLVAMLRAMRHLSGVTVDTINASQDDLVADLQRLKPTLQQLAKAGDDLPKSLQLLLTPPFPDAAVRGFKGDYANLYATIDFNFSDIIDNLSRSRQNLLDTAIPNSPLQGLLGGQQGSDGGAGLPLAPLTPPSGESGSAAGGGLSGLLGTLVNGGA